MSQWVQRLALLCFAASGRISLAFSPSHGMQTTSWGRLMRLRAMGDTEAQTLVADAARGLRPAFEEIDSQTRRSIQKILSSYKTHQVGTNMFAGLDGYGHGDVGRDTFDQVFAELMGAEAALVRVQCFSGTHAIACALFGVLRPGDTLLACSGSPYDTLDEVIGTRTPQEDTYGDDPLEAGLVGNLKEFGIRYDEIPLLETGGLDLPAIEAALKADHTIKMVHLQRSCGYQARPSISIARIEEFCRAVRARRPDVVMFVDNCYGEFVEELEPCHVGADLVAGSFIKNPGGTIVRSGGYVAGKRAYVRAAANRMSSPGVAGGATLGQNQNLYQGLFLSPTIIGESLKGSMLLAEVFGARLGLPTNPPPGGKRTDIIQALQLGSKEAVLTFCEVVQENSPVSAFCKPVPGTSSGYGDECIFADGTFVDGSTLELSADGPLREPYVVYSQGCTHWTHWAIIIEQALVRMELTEMTDSTETETTRAGAREPVATK
ncbi:unnamed protein product [Chrysoparadoxa australica]